MARLQRRLSAPLLVLLTAVAVAFGYGSYEAFVRGRVLRSRVHDVQRAGELVVRLNALQGETQVDTLRYVARPDALVAADLRRLDADTAGTLEELRALQTTRAARRLFAQYTSAHQSRAEARRRLTADAEAGSPEAVELSARRWDLTRRFAEALLADVSAYNLNVLQRTVREVDARRRTSLVLLAAALALSLGVVLGYAWLVRAVVVQPIASLTTAAFGLPSAAFEPPPGALRRLDEIGELARTLVRVTEEMRTANEKLRESDRRKDEFLAMLSHELRNPLAPISNSLYILRMVEGGSPEARRAHEVAERQLAHLTRIVDDLLDVTRVVQGRVALRPERVDAAELARHTAEDHRSLLDERGVELAIATSGPLPVDADPTRIVQVIGNLLQNAARFTPAGGRVSVTAAAEGGLAVVRVCDTGPGVDSELVDSLFEPFVQGPQTLARSEGGLGLGLALVKGLVELHGGSVEASNVPGGGSAFVVRLPLAQA